MMITPSATVAGHRITQTLGLVRGNTIRARHVGKDILAGFRNIVGGEVSEYTKLFAEARGIDVHTHAGYWWEHSTPGRYLQGIANVLDGRALLPWAERPVIGVDASATIGAGARLDERIYVGPKAVIGAGTTLGPHVQIGAGARLAPGIHVERAAVWPGASLDHDLIDNVQI